MEWNGKGHLVNALVRDKQLVGVGPTLYTTLKKSKT